MSDNNQATAGYTDWKNWGADQFGNCSKGDARYFAWHLQRCHPGAVKQVLEIGYGNGNFMGFARDRGMQVVGIEMLEGLRQRAQQAGFEAHASVDALQAGQRFDLIVAFDVFEHIPQDQLMPLLQQLSKHLDAGGVMLLRVPNGESPFGRIFQHGDLTHVTTLGLSKFQQLAAACGLVVQSHGEWPWHRSARNPKRLMRAALRRLIERLVAFAYHWDVETMAPNLVVALQLAEKAPASN